MRCGTRRDGCSVKSRGCAGGSSGWSAARPRPARPAGSQRSTVFDRVHSASRLGGQRWAARGAVPGGFATASGLSRWSHSRSVYRDTPSRAGAPGTASRTTLLDPLPAHPGLPQQPGSQRFADPSARDTAARSQGRQQPVCHAPSHPAHDLAADHAQHRRQVTYPSPVTHAGCPPPKVGALCGSMPLT